MNCFLTREFKDEATELLPFISFVFLSDAEFSLDSADVVVADILVVYVSGICVLTCWYKIRSGAFILYLFMSLL